MGCCHHHAIAAGGESGFDVLSHALEPYTARPYTSRARWAGTTSPACTAARCSTGRARRNGSN